MSTTCWFSPGIALALALELAWLFAELEQPASATAAAVTPTATTENLRLCAIPMCLPLEWTVGRTLLVTGGSEAACWELGLVADLVNRLSGGSADQRYQRDREDDRRQQ